MVENFDTAGELLGELRKKLQGEPTFEVRRGIVKTLVREIIVHTEPKDGGGRPIAKITAQFNFSKDVIRTHVRAENNLYNDVIKETYLPPWLSGHIWHGDTPGARLRISRIASKMTIRDLATASGLSTSTISKLESDKTSAGLPHLRCLAEILGVPVAFLGCFESLPEETLGQRITNARKCCGMMMKEFAAVLGVNVKTLRCWEKNSQNPSKGKYKNLVLYLDILGTNYGNNNLPL